MPPATALSPPLAQYALLEIRSITDQKALVGAFKSIDGLGATIEVLEYAEGGNNDFVHRLPGRVTYPNLNFAWGFTVGTVLQGWFFKTHVQSELTEITVTLYDRTTNGSGGQKRTFVFADAYPVRWTGPSIHSSDPGSFTTWEEALEVAHSGLRLSS